MKVLVLDCSALHLGFLGCYGNTWIATPNIDRLAAEGIVFDQHYADNLNHPTWLTGRFDWTQPLHSFHDRMPIPAEVASCVYIGGRRDVAAVSDATPLEQTLEATVQALEGLANQPRWLCSVELPSLHPPWNVSAEFTQPYLEEEGEEAEQDNEPFEPLLNPPLGPLDLDDLVWWERLRCTYAGAVTYLDAGLGLLLDELRNLDLLDDLTLIFTAHRGLALGEHGIVGDWLPWLHEEIVHLPLIMRQPHAADANRRVSALTQPVDLAATVLDLFGASVQELDGRSWLPLLRGEVEDLRPNCVTSWKLADDVEWALRTPTCALLLPVQQASGGQPRPVQLYLKPEDRWEVNNVIQHHLELAEELEKSLRAVTTKEEGGRKKEE